MRLLKMAAILGILSSALTITAAESEPKPQSDPLYIHFFTPNPDGSNETLHLLTVRLQTPDDFEVVTQWSFEGQVDAGEKKLVVNLKTAFNGGTFSGEVERGKQYETSPVVASPAVRLCSFAITTDKDPKEFVSRPYFQKE